MDLTVAVLLTLACNGFFGSVTGYDRTIFSVLTDKQLSDYTKDPTWIEKTCSLNSGQQYPTVTITIRAVKNADKLPPRYTFADVEFKQDETSEAKPLAKYNLSYDGTGDDEFLQVVCSGIVFKEISANKVVVGLYDTASTIDWGGYVTVVKVCSTIPYSISAAEVTGGPLENVGCDILMKDYNINTKLTNQNDAPEEKQST